MAKGKSGQGLKNTRSGAMATPKGRDVANHPAPGDFSTMKARTPGKTNTMGVREDGSRRDERIDGDVDAMLRAAGRL